MDSIVAATSTPYMFSTWSHQAAPYATQPPGRFQEFCFFLVSSRLVKEDKLQAFRGQESWKGLSDSFERYIARALKWEEEKQMEGSHPRSRENKFQVHLPKAIYRFFIPPFPPLLFKS